MDIMLQPNPGPGGQRWRELVLQQSQGDMLGRSQAAWRELTRRELHLDTERPIVATGHQTLLWHPGILAKYLVVDAVARELGLATANLIVDQHVDHFGEVDVPVRREDGSLATRTIMLTRGQSDVPMGLQPAFTAELPLNIHPAIDSAGAGLERIVCTVNLHRDAPNAALQMARTLDDLMRRWVEPMPGVTATDLINTTLGRAMLQAMAENPQAMAEAYNRAVGSLPEAGIPALMVRDDYVELPLWRIQPDGRRVRAYDGDVQTWLEAAAAGTPVADLPFRGLLPRALFMTGLVRLGMCDLFVHGTGGANYDRAMERWMRDWLEVDVGCIAVATATVCLPIEIGPPIDVDAARYAARRAWHDPESAAEPAAASPGRTKRELLKRIEALPAGSLDRRRAFHDMHDVLERLRKAHGEVISRAEATAREAERRRMDAAIAGRRDWAFALYPESQLDTLAKGIQQHMSGRPIVPTLCAESCG